MYRLTKETITDPVNGNRTISYGYDAVGNRLTKTDSVGGVTTYSYDDNDRLLKEELRPNGVLVKTTEYRYDANGNTTRKIENGTQETVYTWNQEKRLVGVQTPTGESISYAYDADGVRASKTVNGVTTEFLVDKNLPYAQVLEELVNDSAIASYVHGLDLISQERGNVDSYYLVDGLGSTRGLTDASGVVTDTYSYDAFGNLIASAGATANNYRFAGEQFDPNLGDYYLRQRYYDTETGRFTRRDTYEGTLEDPMSLHKYLYAHANPVNYIDPSGLSTTTIGDLTSLIAAISALVAIYWAAPTIKLATEESINNFLDLYVPYFASQRGHQGNQGDTGILEEARGLIGETGSNGKIIQTMEEALTELMREAKKNKDNAKIKRIEKTQKAIKNRNKSKRNEY